MEFIAPSNKPPEETSQPSPDGTARTERRIYLLDRKALAYFETRATPSFWDDHWAAADFRRMVLSCKTDRTFMPRVVKYLPKGSTVMEGGCGRAQLVNALRHQGYRGIGIDFAPRTIARIKEAVPELDVRLGDVRSLPIESESLDGYISGGVIEHFWEGYDAILAEMARTIKPCGFLFVTFPYMSVARRLKAQAGFYERGRSADVAALRGSFYQFALPWRQVLRDLSSRGFKLCESRPCSGIKGMKDEVACLRAYLQSLYNGGGWRITRYALDCAFAVFAGHAMLLVMQKGAKS